MLSVDILYTSLEELRMKINICYASQTGNTKMLADLIEDTYRAYLVPTCEEADLVFLGSWTDKGCMVGSIQEYAKHLRHKKVFLFGTCGFGGRDYQEQLFQRASAMLDDSCQIIGHFYCQGKMPVAVRDRYVSMLQEHPDDRHLQVSIDNFDQALGHPNAQDFNDLKAVLAQLDL